MGCAVTRSTTPPVTFLTGDGCPNATTMRRHLDAALKAEGWSASYAVIDVDGLPATDPRGGYGTPTVLVGDDDLFGTAEPQTPIAADTPS